MNILDYIIIGLITFLVIKGIFRGFFREISSLAGIIFGLLLANHYHPQMAEALKPYLPLGKSLLVLSFIAIFLLIIVLSNLLGSLLHYIFKRLFVGWFDRSLGIGFALIKGIIISYLLILILTFFVPSQAPLLVNSKTAPLVKNSFESMRRLVSPDLYSLWKKRISEKTKDIGRVISDGKDAVEKLPKVFPEIKGSSE